MSRFWDQPLIARAFGVSVNTVQSSWRNATLRAVREHLDAHGWPDPDRALGGPVEQVTRLEFEVVRKRLALPPLSLPNIALPLPDEVIGNKPGWLESSIQAWADATGRRDEHGRLRRSSPPGRPAGIAETQPRQRRRQP